MADSAQTDETRTAEAQPAIREVKIDIRSVVIATILECGEQGVTWSGLGWHFSHGEMLAKARPELDALATEGIVTTRRGQVATGGTMDDFYILAPGVKIIL